MFLSKNKNNNVYPCQPRFYYTEVRWKGIKIIYACFRDDFGHIHCCKYEFQSNISNIKIRLIWIYAVSKGICIGLYGWNSTCTRRMPDRLGRCPAFYLTRETHITKTRLFRCTENFTSKNWKFSDKKLWFFFIHYCSKYRLWVLVRTASPRLFLRIPTIYAFEQK